MPRPNFTAGKATSGKHYVQYVPANMRVRPARVVGGATTSLNLRTSSQQTLTAVPKRTARGQTGVWYYG